MPHMGCVVHSGPADLPCHCTTEEKPGRGQGAQGRILRENSCQPGMELPDSGPQMYHVTAAKEELPGKRAGF